MDATTATLVVAVGTFALAGVTLALALITRGQGTAIREQAGLAREALTVSTRPLLADARPEEAHESNIQFGAPMRPRINLPERQGFYFDPDHGGVALCTVPFRNIGAGVAVVTSAKSEPDGSVDVIVSSKFVPSGAVVRVNLSAHAGTSAIDPLEGFSVIISYSGADGGQRLITQADVRWLATSGPDVRRIAIFRDGENEPFAVSEPPTSGY
jgi:hypothetical protein